MVEIPVGSAMLQLVAGDITRQDTQAVVNAANARLAPGGGVAGAIHQAAGPGLWEECAALGGCATGEAKLSGGHNLPNAYIIHTVGPVYQARPRDAVLLKACYQNCLALADVHGITSIAFPALSTGIFGYPLHEAAAVALDSILEYLRGATALQTVRMVLYDQAALDAHQAYLKAKGLL